MEMEDKEGLRIACFYLENIQTVVVHSPVCQYNKNKMLKKRGGGGDDFSSNKVIFVHKTEAGNSLISKHEQHLIQHKPPLTNHI